LAYRLQLPDGTEGVHNVFHVSMLRKYLWYTEHKIDVEMITMQQDLTLEYCPMRILESSEHIMRIRTIKYVRVLWTNQSDREATWEPEDLMRKKYLKLFETIDLSDSCFVYLFIGLYTHMCVLENG
jgi:hypothetical protein